MAEVLDSGALVGWENLIDIATGNPIAYQKKIVETFPDTLFMAIYNKVSELTTGPNEEEKEALESAPLSASAPSSKIADDVAVLPA